MERDTFLPLVRDPDRSIYIRQEMDSLILGMYEAHGQQWKKHGVPWDYAQEELNPNIDNIAVGDHFVRHDLQLRQAGATHVKIFGGGGGTILPTEEPALAEFFGGMRGSIHLTAQGLAAHMASISRRPSSVRL